MNHAAWTAMALLEMTTRDLWGNRRLCAYGMTVGHLTWRYYRRMIGALEFVDLGL